MIPRFKTIRRVAPSLFKSICLAVLLAPGIGWAQSNWPIYSDSLASGWLDYSYNCTRDFANTAPVYSGSDSISVTITSAYGGLQLYHAPMTNTAYTSISFWLNGGATGGQQLQMYGNLGTGPTAQSQRFSLNTPLVNTWQEYVVPLSALGVADATNFSGFAIQDSAGGTEPAFYVDDIELISATPPAVTHLTVNASQPLRTADARWYGMNTPIWDSLLDTTQTFSLITNMGLQAIRIPGGSDSDDYHWVYNRQDEDDWTWSISAANFINVITNLNLQTVTTMNYGTGSSNEGAAWVAYVNAATTNTTSLGADPSGSNWQTAGYWASIRAASPLGADDGKNFLRLKRSAAIGCQYWEIGNEVYGSWETDSNSIPHDPYTYATQAKGYIGLIKAVYPAARVGVVVTPGEDSFVNNMNHPVVNPRTGQTHYGWTPVLLATLKSLGVTPDFCIHHRYPQNSGSESDAGLLASSTGWISDAGNLRQQITDYMGTAIGTNIELLCTENNSVSTAPGRQSVSLVNGLFRLDSLGGLMQTEFNGLFWWDLRNGQETDGNMSSSLYGWRMYGDYGVVSGDTTLYPQYYTSKLLTHFVQGGDTVLSAASDYYTLSDYAVRRLDGSLAILVINKDPSNTMTGEIKLTGFTPAAGGTIYSYGIPQDNAAETGTGSPDIASASFAGAGTNFNYAFPPYSASVLVLAPAPVKLGVGKGAAATNQFVMQLQGQAGVPYVIQRSTNLTSTNWITVSTNTPATTNLNITNTLQPGAPAQYWRAIWKP